MGCRGRTFSNALYLPPRLVYAPLKIAVTCPRRKSQKGRTIKLLHLQCRCLEQRGYIPFSSSLLSVPWRDFSNRNRQDDGNLLTCTPEMGKAVAQNPHQTNPKQHIFYILVPLLLSSTRHLVSLMDAVVLWE